MGATWRTCASAAGSKRSTSSQSEVERLERLRDAHAALGLEVEVEVDDRARRPARSFGERLEQSDERVGDLLAREACHRPRRTRA